jgi:hypothetical protein
MAMDDGLGFVDHIFTTTEPWKPPIEFSVVLECVSTFFNTTSVKSSQRMRTS